jgi:NTE family protein
MTDGRRQRKPVSLALQGGGAHGAFTWGVLDALLADGRLEIVAISGTSAGAMNAVVAASGLQQDGPDGARAALEAFWRRVSAAALFSPVRRGLLDALLGTWSLDASPGLAAFDALTRVTSPYQFNPLNLNPLREVLEASADFAAVRRCERMKLFISATNVETGRVQLFDRHGLTADMVMASACLPYLFQTVVIDGVPYWDGGFMGNPALFPLFEVRETKDIVIVQINPVERKGVPRTAREIQDRMNEITFNASLLAELRAIDFVRRLLNAGAVSRERYRKMRLHLIEDGEALGPLGASSKLNAEWEFLTHLRDIGQRTARRWLDMHFDALGRSSTVDIRAMFRGDGRTPRSAAPPAPAAD